MFIKRDISLEALKGLKTHVTHVGDMRNGCKILVGQPERKKTYLEVHEGLDLLLKRNLKN
jgi:hypothetical protein